MIGFKDYLKEKVDIPEFNSSPSQAELNAMGVKSERTQIETTIAAKIKPDLTPEELRDGLEYGAGLCHGAKALGLESFEPYPDQMKKVIPTYTNVAQIKKKYKFILCSYVLNVVGYDQRDIIIKNIGNLLKPGGRAVIIVRGAEDVKGIKVRLVTYGDYEFLTKKGGDLTYQKGFTQPELINLAQDNLGDGFKIMKFNGSNAKSVRIQIVKEDNDDTV